MDPYLVQQPDGRWRDARYQFGPGQRVFIKAGPDRGKFATVQLCKGRLQVHGQHVDEVGHGVKLGDGSHVEVQWDWVERARRQV